MLIVSDQTTQHKRHFALDRPCLPHVAVALTLFNISGSLSNRHDEAGVGEQAWSDHI